MSSEKGGYPDQQQQYNQPPHSGYQQPPPQYEQYNQYPPPGYAYDGHSRFQPQPPPGQTQVLVAPSAVTMAEPPPPDQMTKAILVTLCCFWPTGIFAIMKASEARTAYARGDIASARANAASARQLANISIVVGIISIVVSMIIVGVYVGLIMSNMR